MKAQDGSRGGGSSDDASAAEPPEPVSEYLRFLISEWQAAGKTLKDLAEQAGLAKSMPSQIKARTSGSSFYGAAKLAPVFGYRDLPSLVTAAYAWWSSDRTARPDRYEDGVTAARASLETVAAELGYTADEVNTAAMVASMVRRDAELAREKAEELLSRARLFIRDGKRSVADDDPTPPSPALKLIRSR